MVGQHIGQYHVLDLIGRGGMGAVYRASDDMLARDVALKVLDSALEISPERFRTEAVALARLSHPGIATVYQLFQHDDRLVMAMELVRGHSLQQVAEQMGAFSPQRAAEICIQALGALAHAHSAGVVHRDLKPSNLMITETGAIKIMDFGIARLDGAAHLTNAGFAMGTPAYMAPEQLQGQPIDARADLYAMGVVFYRLISAQLPFRGDTSYAMVQAQINEPPTPIDLVRPDLPAWVHEVATRALAKSPDQRFQSALEFQKTLAGCLAGVPISAAYRGDGATEATAVSPATPPRRHPVAAWVAAGAIAAAIGGTVWLGTTIGPAPPDRVPGEAISQIVPAVSQDTATAPAPLLPPPVPEPVAAPDDATASTMFSKVKLLIVNGTRTDDRDVLLLFSNGQITALPAGGGDPLTTVPYRRIAKATYAHARDPQWDPLLGAPAGRLNMPGLFGRSRHWLVVQTKETYAILRLDGAEWSAILQTFESLTGVSVDRASATDK